MLVKLQVQMSGDYAEFNKVLANAIIKIVQNMLDTVELDTDLTWKIEE